MLLKNPLYRPADLVPHSKKESSRSKKQWPEAIGLLASEVRKCGLKKAALYTNYVINNGVPAGMIRKDSGACLKYIDHSGKVKILFCDHYYKVYDNVSSIAIKLQHWRMSRQQPVKVREIINTKNTVELFS